jgi:hypothetical protein
MQEETIDNEKINESIKLFKNEINEFKNNSLCGNVSLQVNFFQGGITSIDTMIKFQKK